MVNTRPEHVKCCICKKKLLDNNQLEAPYQQYYTLLRNEGLSPDEIIAPAGWDPPEPSCFDFSRCTRMASDERLNY